MADQLNQQPAGGTAPTGYSERHESRAGATYKAFLRDLASIGNFDEAFAERAAVSVLCALQQRVIADEAEDLNAQLPSKLRDLLHQSCELHKDKPEKFGRDELFQRVAKELEMNTGEVEPIIRAVTTAVRAQVSEGEAEEFGNMLPADIRELWMRPS